MAGYKLESKKISVVTVCYNSEETIRDTIESVLSQDYQNVEYIIVDGASKDSTMSIINQYRDRISHVVSEPDNGIYDAMNKGLKLASGDFIGILNSDDVFSSNNSVSQIVDYINQNPEVDAIYGDLVYVDRSDLNKVIRLYPSSGFRPWKVRFGFMLPHPTFYARKELFQRLGYYKTNYRVAADFELLSRFITNRVTMGRVSETLVKMRDGGISSTGFWWRVHQNFEIVRACRSNGIYTNIIFVALKVPFKIASYFWPEK